MQACQDEQASGILQEQWGSDDKTNEVQHQSIKSGTQYIQSLKTDSSFIFQFVDWNKGLWNAMQVAFHWAVAKPLSSHDLLFHLTDFTGLSQYICFYHKYKIKLMETCDQ